MRIEAIDRVDCNAYLLASQSSIQKLLGMVLLMMVLQSTSKFRYSPIFASYFCSLRSGAWRRAIRSTDGCSYGSGWICRIPI